MSYRGKSKGSYGNQPHRSVAMVQAGRTYRARNLDAHLKAPIANSEEQWASDPSHYDLPGVDLPRQLALPAPRPKEPWEMNWKDFFEHNNGLSEYSAVEKYGLPSVNRVPLEQGQGPEERIRKAVLRKAIMEGKTVPSEILSEYPDIKAIADRYAKAKAENLDAITLRSKYRPWVETTIEKSPDGKYAKTTTEFGEVKSHKEITQDEASADIRSMAHLQQSNAGFITKIGKDIPINPVIPGSTATYNKATNWLSVTFDSVPTIVTRNELKRNGFRYEPYSKRWRASFSTDREDLIKHYAGAIEEINIEPNWAAKAEHSAEMAAKHEGLSDEAHAKADKINDMIPFGQPILVGHHSERKHRNDIDRFGRYVEKAIDEHHVAESYADRAARYGAKATGERPDVIYRRLKKLEAEKRKMERRLADSDYSRTEEDKLHFKRWLDHYNSRIAVESEKYKASGGIATDKVQLQKGDRVKTTHGLGTVGSVSSKTLRVLLDPMDNGRPRWIYANSKGESLLKKDDILGKA